MQAGDTHEKHVGPNFTDRLEAGRSHRHHRVLNSRPPEQYHLNGLVLDEFNSDGWAVSDDGGIQLRWQMPRNLSGSGTAIKDDNLAGLNQCCCRATNGDFAFMPNLFAARKMYNRG